MSHTFSKGTKRRLFQAVMRLLSKGAVDSDAVLRKRTTVIIVRFMDEHELRAVRPSAEIPSMVFATLWALFHDWARSEKRAGRNMWAKPSPRETSGGSPLH